MATSKSKSIKEFVFEWEGKDRNGKQVRGETRAAGENQVKAALRRQGVMPSKIKKRSFLTVQLRKCFSPAFNLSVQFNELTAVLCVSAQLVKHRLQWLQ